MKLNEKTQISEGFMDFWVLNKVAFLTSVQNAAMASTSGCNVREKYPASWGDLIMVLAWSLRLVTAGR